MNNYQYNFIKCKKKIKISFEFNKFVMCKELIHIYDDNNTLKVRQLRTKQH